MLDLNIQDTLLDLLISNSKGLYKQLHKQN